MEVNCIYISVKTAKKQNNGGWIEAKRKNSKSGSKESSVKSSTSNTSSGTQQVEKMKRIIREEGRDARNLLYWTVPPVPQETGLRKNSDNFKNIENSNGRYRVKR